MAYFAAFHSGEPAAIEQMIDFYGGAGTFAGWPPRVRDYAVQTTPVNYLTWASAYGFALTRSCLRPIEIPTLVVWGEASHPAINAPTSFSASASRTPRSSLSGSGPLHDLVPCQDVARIIARHLAHTEEGAPAAFNGS